MGEREFTGVGQNLEKCNAGRPSWYLGYGTVMLRTKSVLDPGIGQRNSDAAVLGKLNVGRPTLQKYER